LENTADRMIGLYRDKLEHADSPDKDLAELIVLKKGQFGDDVGTTRRLVWVGKSYRDYAYLPTARFFAYRYGPPASSGTKNRCKALAGRSGAHLLFRRRPVTSNRNRNDRTAAAMLASWGMRNGVPSFRR
jgi:hypothetical protein